VNEQPSDVSPLDERRLGERHAELTDVFAHVRAVAEGASRVVGVSWLYHRSAYRSLFPPGYVRTLRPARRHFRGMSLWGQFLSYRGHVHDERAAKLLSALDETTSVDDLDACFPHQTLTAEAPLEDHYRR
jgi:hypothetical protein